MKPTVTYLYLLRHTPFFTELNTDQLRWVIQHSREWEVQAGRSIVSSDSSGDGTGYWVLLDGSWDLELQGRHHASGHADPGKWFNRELISTDAFKLKANEEVQAMAQQLREAEVKTSTVDDRIGEMTALLGNSEREVAKLYAELQTERRERAKLEVQLEANAKELKTTRSKNTKLEKEISSAKGQKLSDIQAQLDRLSALNEELQAKLDAAEADKTHYMQAVEGQKGKLRPLPPPADEGQP